MNSMEWFGVALGGMTGSIFRHAVGYASLACFGASYPFGTTIVNLVGSVLIGFLASVASHQQWSGSSFELALRVGVLGGFTTFSAFSIETFRLIEGGRLGLAGLSVGIHLLGGIAAVALGMRCAEWFVSFGK